MDNKKRTKFTIVVTLFDRFLKADQSRRRDTGIGGEECSARETTCVASVIISREYLSDVFRASRYLLLLSSYISLTMI
jgi:hypothetical protein